MESFWLKVPADFYAQPRMYLVTDTENPSLVPYAPADEQEKKDSVVIVVGMFGQALNKFSVVIPGQLKFNPGEFKGIHWGDSLFQLSNLHS